jgi:hypothetical protein
VPTGWPSGDPVVSLALERVFHQERADGSHTREPAGYADVTVCLACADALWSGLREVLGGLVRKERTGGD